MPAPTRLTCMDTSNTKIQLILGAATVIIAGILVYFFTQTPITTVDTGSTQSGESLIGCYVVRREKSVYTLTIAQQYGSRINGTLTYKNFEMDSSSGSFEGTYADGILIGYYSFSSEGEDSVRQMVFKKVGNSFLQGFGQVRTEGNREVFIDLSAVTYDPALTFTLDENCS